MAYYEEKKRAYRRIDELLKKKVPKDKIIYLIATEYGFSKKIVEERFKMIENFNGAPLE